MAEIKGRFGDSLNFLKIFNPSNVSKYVRQNEMKCFTGAAPSIARTSITYGRDIAISWLTIQLRAVGEYSGANKQTIEQMEETAEVILVEFPFLKVTELMVFFHRLKAGYYGTFFGNVDGIKICDALRTFLLYRKGKLDEYDAEQRRKKREEQEKYDKENAITYDEYKRLCQAESESNEQV